MKRLFRIITPFLLVGAGVLFIVLGAMNGTKQKSYTETQAVISHIASEYDATDGSTDYTVYVTYTVDGKEYTDIPLDSYHAGMNEGDTVAIKYNPNNPSEIITAGSLTKLIMIGFGVLVILVGVVLFFKRFR